jgi:hypothetical protein
MHAMGVGPAERSRKPWLIVVVGAALGLAIGILVSVETDLPLAPEVGFLLGLFLGWLSTRSSRG